MNLRHLTGDMGGAMSKANDRPKGRSIAQDTVRILNAGFYEHPQAGPVDISDALGKARAGTLLYRPEDSSMIREKRDQALAGRRDAGKPIIEIVNGSTVDVARKLVEAGASNCLVLNFASAKNPGGGFLGGAQAQEESLARSTGLYACLLTQPEYYAANRAFGSCLYTDHVIYSPGVPFIRDDRGALLTRPTGAAIITAPAPNDGAIPASRHEERQAIPATLKRRMELVLSIAVIHAHRNLVLGAWGCGVFRNDPHFVAESFRAFLFEDTAFRGAFDRIVFAILDWSPGKRFIGPFERVFTNVD